MRLDCIQAPRALESRPTTIPDDDTRRPRPVAHALVEDIVDAAVVDGRRRGSRRVQ
ncbi:MAG: hypothetical protein KC468_32855 [Myxococcales bacterium]|nr:hypothetical protein [Myxococcales bacterium]